MASKKGAIPKKSLSKQDSKSKSKSSPTPKPNNKTAHPCQACHVTDNEEKVCCDLCRFWYHLKCENVSSDVKKRHWACAACMIKNTEDSASGLHGENVNREPEVVLIDDSIVSHNKSATVNTDVVSNTHQVVVSQANEGQSTIHTVNVQNTNEKEPPRSHKAKSTSSTVSRRTALALQRLEEEKQLREQRDADYLDKKYSLLEDDTEDEKSLADTELEREKLNRVEQWSQNLLRVRESVAENIPIGNTLSKVKLLDTRLVANDTAKDSIECSSHPNVYSTSVPVSETRSGKFGRQRSSVGIMKSKVAETSLPAWLTAPPKSLAKQKVSSSILATTTMNSFTNVASVSLSAPSSCPLESMDEIIKTTSVGNIAPQKPAFALTSTGDQSLQLQSNFKSNFTKFPWKASSFRQIAEDPPNQRCSENLQPVVSSVNSQFGIQLVTTSNNQMVAPNPFGFFPQNTKPIYAVNSNNQPDNSSQITQSSPMFNGNLAAGVSVTSESSNFHFGFHPSTPSNVISSDVGQSSIFSSTQQVKNSFGTIQPPESSGSLFFDHGQGASSTYTVNKPITTSRVFSQGMHFTTNPSPQFTSSTSSQMSSFGMSFSNNVPPQVTQTLFGPSSQHNQSTPNTSGNQYVGYRNMTPSGTLAANTSNGLLTMQSPRLTAEQIATRHVIKQLPKFYGEPKHWQAFISAYEYSTEACGFSPVENLGRLQESLQGDAKDAVGGRLIHPNSVPRVISILKLMYGRPEAIIESLVEEINKEPSPKENDLPALMRFAISVQNLSASIQETGAVEHLQNPMLISTITDKLPTQIQLNWAYYKHSIGTVDLSNLGDWLYNLADVVSQVVRKPMIKVAKKEKNNNNNKSTNYLNTQVEKKSKSQNAKEPSGKSKCLACKAESCTKTASCTKFKSWSRAERWTFVKENKLCSRCLGPHSFYRCRSNQSCRADGCIKKHHTMLHDDGKSTETPRKESKPSEVKATSNAEASTPTSVCNSQRSIKNRTDMFRIVPVVLSHNDEVIRDFAYLDEGSNLTLIEDALADELKLVGTPQSVCIDWAFGQSHESEESRIVSMKIAGFYHQAPNYKLNNVRTVKDLHLPSQSITSAWLERYPHFKNVPITTYETVKPRMLIGLQYSKLTVSLETIEGAWDEPMVCRTRLGWVVQGPSYNGEQQTQKKFSLNLCQCQSKDHQLHKLVKEYFSIENFGVKIDDKFLESREVQRARDILESTTVKKNGRYESGLLWKYDEINLPNSYSMALKRLQCLESKMMKNPKLSENMCKQISGFVEKGYIRKLNTNELQVKPEREWYLPIFPVFNPKKPEKVRIVWDAAAKVKNVSLNSMLLTGPDLLVPLVDILRRFRERLIAVLGDIGEMYHQIRIIERDQGVQRFLWRNGDSTKKPDVYVMLVSTFGAACAPCTAQFVKNKNADEFKHQYPDAVAAITQNTYVDDLLDCCHNVEKAIQLARDVKHVNLQGGFETRNFLSNSKEVLESVGERETNSSNKNLNINTDLTLGIERVLGMFWNADTDTFTYSLKYTKVNQSILNGTHCPTKRELLRVLMSIYDPLGLLANFLVYPKLLLQETWRSNVEWDEKIPEILHVKWVKWITALSNVENVQIPRLYSPKLSPRAPNSIQLHVFVDGSAEAFATAAYLRIQDDGGIDCCLVGAKTKVAPNKPMTIPRLELQAGVLGARLSRSIKQSQRLDFEKVIYWSDSMTVMGWINSDTRRYHQFVAFRIGEILESTDKAEWRWVPTEHNVADEATKSKDIKQLDSHSRWFKGPDFLYDDESTWFAEENHDEHVTKEELRLSIVMACRQGQVEFSLINVKRFSQWNRLVNAMAYVYRFIENLKSKERRSGPLMQDEIIRSENQLYRIAQQEHFLDEIALLERNTKLPPDEQEYFEKSSELYKSSPYLDDHGVLRVRGRLDAATCLSEQTKRPIIMPRRHYITKLIVNHYHRRYLHLNHETAINEIRQKYDIRALRVVMKEVRHYCQRCKNDSARPQIPEMAELPYARLAAFERPYSYVGIDYFGPFKVRITRNISASRWGVIYTCLTTRAIHLEVAHSLNTSSCIMAFERFCTDCGHPREVYSDNGLNFHGMDNELKEEFKKLNQDEIQRTYTTSEMKWSFNPPESPHMGGAWESLIRTVKSSFKKVVTTRKPTDETLPTLFSQIENIVNSRPLTYISLDTADCEALTPNHFLFGSSNGLKPIVRSSPRGLGREDWKNLEEQTNQFWRRFVLEYMPTLTKRTKWFKNSKQVQAGDVVLIIDEKNPRNTWPRGIVERTIPGRGGRRRQAIVRAALKSTNGPIHKEYRRSVHKLAILDVKVPAVDEVNRQPEESINEGKLVGQH